MGRPRGSFNNIPELRAKSNEIITRLAPDIREEFNNLLPHDIMLFCARYYLQREEYWNALLAAEKAGPYFSRKLVSIDVNATVTHETRVMDDQQLTGMIQLLAAEYKEI